MKTSYLPRRPWLALLTLLVLGQACLEAHAEQASPAQRHAGTGIWKAFVPHGVAGEFDSYDPVGLMAGALIKADCSLNWRDPDSNKLYCFASGTSQVYFQDFPKANVQRARAGYEKLTQPKPGS